MREFRMPSLGADMASGTLLEWFVKPGSTVKRGDIVALVDTDKAEIEVEIFDDGVIDELVVEAGTKVPVGAVLATLTEPGAARAAVPEAPASPAAAAPPAPEPVSVTPPAPPPAVPPRVAPATPASAAPPAEPAAAPPARPEGRLRVSPLARRAAAQLHVDLTGVTGTGTDAAITLTDVEHAAAGHEPAASAPPDVAEAGHPAAPPPPAPPPPAPAHDDKRAAMQRTTGALMARSKREVPHYYLERSIDLHHATQWLAQHNAHLAPGDRVLPAALLLAATARAAKAVPQMNGLYEDGAFGAHAEIHLGVAISLRGGGLVAPTLRDAGAAGVPDLMARLQDLSIRARQGTLRSSEMTGATLTVTNLGDRGADKVFGVINVPQVAIVGFGAITERPVAVDGMLAVRPTVIATLAADHRVSDGHTGSRFLALLDAALQAPEAL